MASMNIEKVTVLPAVVQPNVMYLSPDPSDPDALIVTCTDGDGTRYVSTASQAKLQEIMTGAVMRSDQPLKTAGDRQEVCIDESGKLWTIAPPVQTTIKTMYMPNVGDFTEIRLGAQIVLKLEKTTNGGYEGYKSSMHSYDADRLICYRRDSIYDNVSAEGSNANLITLTPGASQTIDSLIYGSMRDWGHLIFVDMVTLESWFIQKFFFGKSLGRVVIHHHVDPEVESGAFPIPVSVEETPSP